MALIARENRKFSLTPACYQNTLGFGGNFIFAESLEEARLMVVGNRGFLPIEVAEFHRQALPLEGFAYARETTSSQATIAFFAKG